MALQLSWESPEIGATFPQAYARIIRFRGDKEMIEAVVAVHADAKARELEKNPVAQMNVSIPLPEGSFDPMNMLYLAMKQQEAFSKGSDV